MNAELTHLKAVIEGKPDLPRWREWFAEHEPELKQMLPRGQFLRLRYYPIKEIPKILSEQGIQFTQSDLYEWLDSDSTSGRYHDCGDVLQRARAGDLWIWCPNGCFLMEAHLGLGHKR